MALTGSIQDQASLTRRQSDWNKPSNKLLALTDFDSDTWMGEVRRTRGKKLPLTASDAARSDA